MGDERERNGKKNVEIGKRDREKKRQIGERRYSPW
jgi:hypothetical protein